MPFVLKPQFRWFLWTSLSICCPKSTKSIYGRDFLFLLLQLSILFLSPPFFLNLGKNKINFCFMGSGEGGTDLWLHTRCVPSASQRLVNFCDVPSVRLSGRLVTVSLLLCTVQLFQLDCPLNLVLNKDKRYSSSSSSTVQFKRKENIRNWNGKNEPTNQRKKERKKRDNREQEKSLSFYLSQEYTLLWSLSELLSLDAAVLHYTHCSLYSRRLL